MSDSDSKSSVVINSFFLFSALVFRDALSILGFLFIKVIFFFVFKVCWEELVLGSTMSRSSKKVATLVLFGWGCLCWGDFGSQSESEFESQFGSEFGLFFSKLF